MAIWDIVRKYRYNIALVMSCYLLQVVVSSINPLYMTRLIDELAKHESARPQVLAGAVVFLLAASVLRLALGVFLARYLGKIALTIAKEVRMHIASHYLSSPRTKVPDPGDFLTTSSRDVNRLVSFVTGDLNSILVSVTSFIGVSLVLAHMNMALYGLIIAFIPLYFIVYKRFSDVRYRLSLDVRNRHGSLSDSMAAATRHQRTIYVHRAQRVIEAQLEHRLQDCNDAEYKSIINNAWSGLALSGISFMMSATAFILGTVLVVQGRVTVGMLMAFTTHTGSLLSPVSNLTNLALSWHDTRVAATKIAYYSGLQETRVGSMAYSPNVCAVSFERAVFQQGGLNLTYRMGLAPITSIAGRTGAGKSTICECLAGYLSPTAGIVVYETETGSVAPSEIRRHVHLVDSHMVLFEELPILLNLTLGVEMPAASIEWVLDLIELKTLLVERDISLSTTAREASFSQGESQRLLIARALLTKPAILILDEALSGVDPAMAERIVRQASKHVSIVIIVSHRLSDHEQSQIVHYVDDGRLLEMAPIRGAE